MTVPRTTLFSTATGGTPELSWPRPERLLRGNPRRETWNAVDQPLTGAARLSSGIWRCEPGHWRIAFGPAQQEVFTVLAGRCRLHDAQGSWQEAGPGDVLHIPAGFSGSFEVLEAMTKSYVIVE